MKFRSHFLHFIETQKYYIILFFSIQKNIKFIPLEFITIIKFYYKQAISGHLGTIFVCLSTDFQFRIIRKFYLKIYNLKNIFSF